MKLKQLDNEAIACVEATLRKHPDWRNHRVAKSHWQRGVTTVHVAEIRQRLNVPGEPVTERASRSRAGGRTLADFRKTYDYALILRNAVALHLSPSSEHYYTDAEFRDLAGIPQQNWRRFADDEALAGYRIKRGEHNLWASLAMVREMKKILGIL